jgi:hypothetical protein
LVRIGLIAIAAAAACLRDGPAVLATGPAPPLALPRQRGRPSGLTGAWRGAYSYAGRDLAVPFNADLVETAGRLSGTISEPNTYADPAFPELFATVEGVRSGAEVSFVKTMDGTAGVRHAIAYAGLVSGDETRIDGRWRLFGASGSFWMARDDTLETVEVEEAETARA